jgi:predicted ATP-dependent protease
MKDLEEVPKEQRKKIQFIPVRYISEVLDVALLPRERSTRAPGTLSISREKKARTKQDVRIRSVER